MSLLFLVLLTALLVAQSTASCATARREIQPVTPIYCACPAKSHDSLWALVGARVSGRPLQAQRGCKLIGRRMHELTAIARGTERGDQPFTTTGQQSYP